MAQKPRMGAHVPPDFALATMDTVYDPPIRGFRTAVAGDVSVVTIEGVTIVLPALLPGETFKGMIKEINASGTTVTSPTTNIVVFW